MNRGNNSRAKAANSDIYNGKNIAKSGESGTLKSELFRKPDRSRSKEKYHYINDKRFDDITAPARRKGAIIMRGIENRAKDLIIDAEDT